MKNLDFKVAVAQMRPTPGNVQANLAHMLTEIKRARDENAQMIVFPELATTGYMLGDLWEHESFLSEIEDANALIRRASTGIVVVWGSVKTDWHKGGEDGRIRKYNAAFIAQNGQYVPNGTLNGWIPKTNLPKYRFFDDARHFYPAGKLAEEMRQERRDFTLNDLLLPFVVTIHGQRLRLGLTVCEDLWENEYIDKPSQIYRDHGVDLLISISQSPWTVQKWKARSKMLTERSKAAKSPILYINSVGLQNNSKNLLWFDGSSTLFDETGHRRWRAPGHAADLFMCDLSDLATEVPIEVHEDTEDLYKVLIAAIRDFFGPKRKVVIGLSGGIDSAVMLALLVVALGKERVLAVNMPTKYNSQTTQDLARACAESFGVEYKVVPIQQLFDVELLMLGNAGYRGTEMLVQENIQSRLRGEVLSAIAACEGALLINNGNKTEVALNYYTLYGDSRGAASFLGDLWKGQVYELARVINAYAECGVIPQGIIDLVPSAELSPEQNVDEGKGDPILYPYHDALLRKFVEGRWDPTLILEKYLHGQLEEALGCPPFTIAKYFKDARAFIEDLEWAWRQYNIEYKRHTLPPVLVTSRRAFGFDRRSSIGEGFTTGDYALLRAQILSRAA